MLSKEVQDRLVAAGIFLLDALVRQVRTGSHPAMNLVRKGLDMLGTGKGSLELLDVLGVLVLRGQHDQRNLDPAGEGISTTLARCGAGLCSLLSVLRVNHSRVDLGSDLEWALAGREGQRDNLGAPAELMTTESAGYCSTKSRVRYTHPEYSPLLDVRVFLLDGLDSGMGLGHEARRAVLAEEGADLLLLLLVVGREQADGQWRAVEGVGHEDGVLVVVVGRGQDVAALHGLVKEAEDVHDDEDGLGGLLGGPGHVCLAAIEGLEIALLLVAGRHDGRDVAAGLGVAAGGFHGGHVGRRCAEWAGQLCVGLVVGDLGSQWAAAGLSRSCEAVGSMSGARGWRYGRGGGERGGDGGKVGSQGIEHIGSGSKLPLCGSHDDRGTDADD